MSIDKLNHHHMLMQKDHPHFHMMLNDHQFFKLVARSPHPWYLSLILQKMEVVIIIPLVIIRS